MPVSSCAPVSFVFYSFLFAMDTEKVNSVLQFIKDLANGPLKRLFIQNRVIVFIFLILFSCAVFYEARAYNSFKNGFHMDDVVAIQKNLDVVTPGSLDWYSFLRHDFWGLDMFSGEWTHKSYRPLTTLTYRWNWLMSGLDTSAFHVTNMLLHGLASALLVVVGEEVLGMSMSDSIMAGALFAVHPVHTESVLYLVGRADTLCAVLMLLGLVFFARDRTMTSYFFVLSSGLAKELGFMAFPILMMLDLLRHPGLSRRLLLTVLVGLGAMYLRHWYTDGTDLKMSPQDNPIAFEDDQLGRFLSYALVHGEYMRLLVYPRFLCYDYSMNTIPLVCELSDLRLLSPISVYLAFFIILGHFLRINSRAGLVATSMFVFTFIPMSNFLFPVGTVVGERLLYIPSMGFIFSSVLILPRKPLVTVGILWCLRTVYRVDDWKTANHLTQMDGAVNPKSAKTMYNLGVQFFTNKLYDEAFSALSQSIEADELRRDGIAVWRLGQIELMRGNIFNAEKLLVSATTKYGAKLMVREEEIFHDAGLALYHNGKIDQAHYYLSAALSINRVFPKALNNMACLLTSLGKLDIALSLLLEASEIKPKNVIYSGNVWIVSTLANRIDLSAWGQARTLSTQPSFVPGSACIWEFKPAQGGPGDTALTD